MLSSQLIMSSMLDTESFPTIPDEMSDKSLLFTEDEIDFMLLEHKRLRAGSLTSLHQI